MSCLNAVARGSHVGVYHHFLEGATFYHDLGLRVGQPSVILGIKGDDVR